jgi:serine protease
MRQALIPAAAAALAAMALCVLPSSAAAAQSASLSARQATPAGSAHGLIVKLRDDAAALRAHSLAVATAAPGAMPLTAAEPAQIARIDGLRQVLASAGRPATRARAVGRSAHLLDFGAPLSADAARQVADQLRNEREQPLATPDDPYFAATAQNTGQWWMRPAGGSSSNTLTDRLRGVPGLLAAWSLSQGNGAPVVAVLDTGITRHPDLDAHVLPGYDFVSTLEYANDGSGRDADPSDPGDWVSQADKTGQPALFAECAVSGSSWHGTAIAGVIGAVSNNGVGVAGVNWNARVLPVRVAGKCGAEVADIVDGMRWAAGLAVAGAPANPNPAKVINISFGGSAPCNAAYQEAINDLRAAGALVVAAAGNSRDSVKRPASCAGVVGVAAVNRDGFKASYSSFGPAVVVSTVGGDPADEGAWGQLLGDDGLLTLDNFGVQAPSSPGYGRQAGTSFSAPVVAGVVSLMWAVNPNLGVDQVITGLQRSARPHVVSGQMAACSAANPGRCLCTTSSCGAGLLDAAQALLYARDPAAYVAPAWQPASVDSPELVRAIALGADQQPNTTGGSGSGATSAASDSGGGALDLSALLWCVLACAALMLSSRPSGRA